MRAGSIALRSAALILAPATAAAALMLASATAAAADDSAKAILAPATTAPGGKVGISATGCTDSTATARSDVFVADAKLTARLGSRGLIGAAKVRPDVSTGTYDVRVRCDGREYPSAGRLRVVGRLSGAAEPVKASPPASPVAPVRAGGGGTMAVAAPVAAVDPEDAGPSSTQTVIGLVLAGAAAVVVAVRSVRNVRRRRADSD